MTDATSGTDATPIAWRAIVYDSPVRGTDGSTIGRVREVLGSDAEDVFHGLRVARDGKSDHDVLVTSDRITAITAAWIATDLAPSEVAGLPAYAEEAGYHLGQVGRFRKHAGWTRDSGSDEEPG